MPKPSIFNHSINLEIKRRLELNYPQEEIARWIGCSRKYLAAHIQKIRDEYDLPFKYTKCKKISYSATLPKSTYLYIPWVTNNSERYYYPK